MATPIMQGQNTGSESVIAGYFSHGDDAHRAINALLDEGFLPSQIGAAFHSSRAAGTSPEQGREEVPVLGGNSMREDLGTTLTASSRSDNSFAGPASDDTAVQPAGIATGAGSPFVGVGKPGPISGSSLAHTGLPSELKSELRSASEVGGTAAAASPVSPAPHLGSGPQHHIAPTDNSWGAKLKHLFSKDDSSLKTGPALSAESQNFGSGSGHLGIEPPYGQPYSRAHFEQSVSSSGVPPEQSRHLAHRLSAGGAVVTVSATGRAIEVEKIFERHHGHVRFASDVLGEEPLIGSEDARVEVFGHLEHRYPGSRD